MSSSSSSPVPNPDLINSLGAIIWEADPLTFQFLYVNRTAQTLLGYSLEDWLSRPNFWSDLLHPDDRDAAVAQRRAAVENAPAHDCEYRAIAADGSIRWMRDIVSVVRGEGGRVDRLRGLMVDITDARMRFEQTLQRLGRMEAFARITSAVAHDLRNVFTVLIGNVDFALEAHAGAGVRGELIEIRDAANLGKAIIEQLSTFGGRERRVTLVDVNDAVQDVRAFLDRLLHPVAELVVDTTAAQSTVLMEGGAVKQILLNLAVNAKEAMGSTGGRVVIATRNVRATVPGSPSEMRDFVEIEVSDTGAGMPQHVTERIFELHFTTKEEMRGAGIGLATVDAIVRDAAGTISVESQLQKGTTFRVRLPVVSSASFRARVDVLHGDNKDPKPSVLVVDDDEAIRRLLRRWLEQWQFAVRLAGSASDALALMAADPAAIVLCDVRMPDRDGVWLMQQIRERWPQTILIATSAGSDLDVIEQVRNLGAVDYVTKPVGRESLKQAMYRARKASGGGEPG
jgi:two-component system cell cycle sensor histidine kinase/response regulator CckA